jgi:hypothetical protein
MVAVVIVAFSQTRNVELAIFIMVLTYAFRKYNVVLYLCYAIVLLILMVALYADHQVFVAVNSLSSSRLTWWLLGYELNFTPQVLNILFGKNVLIAPLEHVMASNKTIFHFDNSYLEILLRDGLIGTILTLLALVIAVFLTSKSDKVQVKEYYISRATGAALLFYFMLDSGLFGTGNLAFVVLWFLSTTKYRSLT